MRVILLSLPALLAAGLLAQTNLITKDDDITWHKDARDTPKVISKPFLTKVFSPKAAMSFLKNNHKIFKLPADLANLSLAKTTKSLLGTHYHFQQNEQGVEVLGAEIILSVSDDGNIYNIFNNTYNIENNNINIRQVITENNAINIAWQNLRVHGALLDTPKARLVYKPIADKVSLVFVTTIATEAPYGYFEHIIDAHSGKILERTEKMITRKPYNWEAAIEAYTGPALERKKLEKQYNERAKLLSVLSLDEEPSESSANGSALVFDPDPRTTLNDDTLSHSSPAESFDKAYYEQVLKDITFNGSIYKLKGPWIEIKDFEGPNTPPSTTTDGHWTAKRGDKAFTDAMTYYHIDNNQRYMQSLGFTNERGIQYKSITVDSDGVHGADNSYFMPSGNRMSFGHGGIPDNEDADVILHEYGHAIQHSINNNWFGGDTGAMGEGFGDYWAGSYSISRPGGKDFRPNEIFTWDGHNSFWPGRVLNALGARYNPNQRYYAHSRIDGGFQSDELWSAPLFQSLLTLLNRDVPREEVDTIVLESHFGLGGNLTMREMANNTVKVARALYPNGPHGDVFYANFVHHNIIEIPTAKLKAGSLSIQNNGTNGYADPGEVLDIFIPILNEGTLAALNMRGEITTSSAHVKIINNIVDYGDLNIGEEKANSIPFVVELSPEHPCGEPINFELKLSYEGGEIKESLVPITLQTGSPLPNPNIFSVVANLDIPDISTEPVVSIITIADSGLNIKASGLSVNIDIKHTFVGDLIITLVSPKGTRVILHDRKGSAQDDLIGNYPRDFSPQESFDKLEGEAFDGDWRLEVSDAAAIDTGKLISWGMEAEFSRICE